MKHNLQNRVIGMERRVIFNTPAESATRMMEDMKKDDEEMDRNSRQEEADQNAPVLLQRAENFIKKHPGDTVVAAAYRDFVRAKNAKEANLHIPSDALAGTLEERANYHEYKKHLTIFVSQAKVIQAQMKIQVNGFLTLEKKFIELEDKQDNSPGIQNGLKQLNAGMISAYKTITKLGEKYETVKERFESGTNELSCPDDLRASLDGIKNERILPDTFPMDEPEPYQIKSNIKSPSDKRYEESFKRSGGHR